VRAHAFRRSDSHGVTLSVTNSKIQHNMVWGIYIGMDARETLSNNTYLDNAMGDTFKDQP
jgi:parallel beta-helix repeat protein